MSNVLNQLIRFWLYVVAGVSSALFGWNLAQLIMADFNILPFLGDESDPIIVVPELILFPCITISLAIGMVINEIFISNPNRLTLCWKKFWPAPFFMASICGAILGLLATVIVRICFAIVDDATISRIVGWFVIGLAVGLSEGLTWMWQSVESRSKKRFNQRFWTSLIGASLASIIAALLFEYIRTLIKTNETFRLLEDPIGFVILGLLLGLAFCITNSPAFQMALRAGGGFEFRGTSVPGLPIQPTISPFPYIKQGATLYLIGTTDENGGIEEGTSVALPGKKRVIIGNEGNKNADIYLPGIPVHAAFIDLTKNPPLLEPNNQYFYAIAINGKPLASDRPLNLKHNTVLTFYTIENGAINHEKFYRFVFYNRFLDPQS